jgi:hypothetical protein
MNYYDDLLRLAAHVSNLAIPGIGTAVEVGMISFLFTAQQFSTFNFAPRIGIQIYNTVDQVKVYRVSTIRLIDHPELSQI